MTKLIRPATGHQINVDEESADFWRAAGYRELEPKSSEKKAPAKKASKKSSK